MAVYDKNGKVIKSAVSYGWEVTSSDVPKALDMWVEHVGEDNALEDIARAMDDDTLIENVEWIAQQWGIGEEVEEERSAWDKYEKAKELMGVHELFTNLTQAAGYDELAEDLAYIFRMNDFRQWDDMEVYSSRKPIKSNNNREEFANRLNKLMKHYSLSFSSGSFEDNMINIYDNYVSQYYDDELKQYGGAEVANDWFHNTYPNDEERIFIQSSRKPIKSSKEEKVNPNDPHMKFKTLDPEHKMDLREDIEDELEALLKKLHVKFDLETWNETVDYILSFFEEDNFYNPKDAKQAVHEWYLDTKDEFPDMFDSKKTKIASSAYREFIHNKMSIKSTHNLIKSAVNEEDPVEVLLKDAAQQLGATYKEGWYGKGIQEGDGRWNGGKWAVLVDTDTYGRPTVQFKADKSGYSEGHITPMNCKTADVEPFPQNLVAWIEDKLSDAESERGDWKSIVEKFENVDAKEIDYVEDNPSKKQILVKLDTEDTDKATDLAQWINGQVGNEDGNFQVYDLWEILEDKYEDLDPEIRDEKVVIFYFND